MHRARTNVSTTLYVIFSNVDSIKLISHIIRILMWHDIIRGVSVVRG